MNIREAALGGDPQSLEAALASAIKATESAISALEAVQVSLMLAASFLRPTEPVDEVSGECRHLQTFTVETMGGVAVMCDGCGLQLTDAMHRE